MKSHLFIFVSLMFIVLSLFSQIPGWASLPAMMAAFELKQDDQSDQVILSNENVSIAFNMSNGMYTITDIASGQIIIDMAGVAADDGHIEVPPPQELKSSFSKVVDKSLVLSKHNLI